LRRFRNTSFLDGDVISAVDATGELRGVTQAAGERMWDTTAATHGGNRRAKSAMAFLAENGDRFSTFNEKGGLAIAKLSAMGYDEISPAHLIEPTGTA
jgi:hypothetical protein